jgi:hypothetical protein
MEEWEEFLRKLESENRMEDPSILDDEGIEGELMRIDAELIGAGEVDFLCVNVDQDELSTNEESFEVKLK